MKKRVTRWGIACLLVVLVVVAMCGCQKDVGKEKAKKKEVTIDIETATMETMAQYFKDKGYISKDSKPVDINTTAGYIKDNTGGSIPFATLADQACDYDGVWLLWWNQKEKTDNFEMFQSMKMNGNTIVVQGGAAILEMKAVNGSFAIAFSKEYDKAEAVLKDFQGLGSK